MVVKKSTKKKKMTIAERRKDFLSRRPHRSFRRTRKRDYKRSFNLPGYWSFTNEVRVILWRHRKIFLSLFAVYTVLSIIFVGIMSQEAYTTFSDSLNTLNSQVMSNQFGPAAQTLTLFGATVTGSLNDAPSEAQQIYGGILFLLGWLTTVWILRQLLAGHKVNLRDAIYSAGAPIVSTLLVFLVILVQLLPAALALIAYGAAQSTGLLEQGFVSMIFWVIASLLILMSIYWITSSLIALVIVTLPGMYPMTALRNAGDLVIGRRLRVMLRLAWLMFINFVIWATILIPIIVVVRAADIVWLPAVPVTVALLSSFSLIFASSYIYLLYRKLIDDKAAPA